VLSPSSFLLLAMASPESAAEWFILYASQTGTSEGIAQTMHHDIITLFASSASPSSSFSSATASVGTSSRLSSRSSSTLGGISEASTASSSAFSLSLSDTSDAAIQSIPKSEDYSVAQAVLARVRLLSVSHYEQVPWFPVSPLVEESDSSCARSAECGDGDQASSLSDGNSLELAPSR
jgi:hypothetical protein